MKNMTNDMKNDFLGFINEAHYAICKQIESSEPIGNYGTIELLENEKEEYNRFLERLMRKRIKLLEKYLENDKK